MSLEDMRQQEAKRKEADEQMLRLHSLRLRYEAEFGRPPKVWLGFGVHPDTVERLLKKALETGKSVEVSDLPPIPKGVEI